MKQNKFWLKLIGVAILLHIILILLSIIEVAIYSFIILPGKDQAFYNAHATLTGPWISAIFGSLLMFFLVKRFLKRFTKQQLTYAIGLPAIYLAIDLMLLFVSGYQLKDFLYQSVLATVPKIVAVSLAYFIYARGKHQGKKIQASPFK
jgi:hypothetical protein